MVSVIKFYEKLYEKFLITYSKVPIKFKYFLSFLFHVIIFFSLLFSRPVVGIYLFNYRLGELIILICLVFALLILLTPIKYFFDFKNDKLVYLYKLIIFYFVVTLFLRETSILEPYTFRSSSYIWTVSIVFFGYYFLSKFNFDKLSTYALLTILPSIYVISTGNYPNFVIDFFISFSDKFVFIKGSDLAIALISCTLLLNVLLENEKIKVFYFFAILSLFLPLLLFNSRAAFVSAAIYLLISIPYYKKKFCFIYYYSYCFNTFIYPFRLSSVWKF